MNPYMRVRAEKLQGAVQTLQVTGHLPFDFDQMLEPGDGQIDRELAQALCDFAAERHESGEWNRDRMDSWLAPRLHCAIRLPRRSATDQRLWAWLAMLNHKYIEVRFSRRDGRPFKNWRYNGELLRNGLSRLWWGAEMTRNGPDYRAVGLCFSGVRTAEFALELRYSWNRPAAIAFCRVVTGADGGHRLADKAKKKLSTTLRVLLALRALEASATEELDDAEEFDEEWAAHIPNLEQLRSASLEELRGPKSGTVPEERITELVSWFREVADSFAADRELQAVSAEAKDGNGEDDIEA